MIITVLLKLLLMHKEPSKLQELIEIIHQIMLIILFVGGLWKFVERKIKVFVVQRDKSLGER